jgi:hypothetical protein
MSAAYPLPWDLFVKLAIASLRRQPRSFSTDARICLEKLPARLRVLGGENIPQAGPCLVVANHYARPGFGAWWLAFAISASLPVEVHWIFTAEWTYPGGLKRWLITPATRVIFNRVAGVYGFTTMPAMPPDPHDVERRAQAVRRVLAYVRKTPRPVIGLTPEGRDFDSGKLGPPPPGAGRFIYHLSAAGLAIFPVGVYEEGVGLCLRFGPAFSLQSMPDLPASERDRFISRVVMEHIAALLPRHLRGEFAGDPES